MTNLKHIEINIGKACNNKCRFCMSSKPELWDIKFVSFDMLKEKIKGYAEKGYKSIGFLGGDISIHPNIIEIVSFCKENGFININAISNGMKFDDFNFTKKLINAGLTRINFSIHSHIDEIEDYLIQVKGGLQRKLKAIDNFKYFYDKGLLRDDLSINIVLNNRNLKTVLETILYFNKIKKINDFRINFIWLNNDTKENWEDLKITYTDFHPYLKQLIYLSLKYNIRITFDTVPACIFYKIDKINYKSLVKRFLGEDLDHITEIDWINKNDKFNWKERKKDMLKMHFDQCKKCDYNVSCQGVRKNYSEIYGGDEFIPITFEIKNIEKIEELDIKYYYEELDKGNLIEIEKEIFDLYSKNTSNVKYVCLYSLLLAKLKKYKKSNEILMYLLDNKTDSISESDMGNIYFDIAVNYTNLNNNEEAGKFLDLAKDIIGDKENFKEFYDNFYGNTKKYNLDDFKKEVSDYYKNNDNIFKKYVYIEDFITKLK